MMKQVKRAAATWIDGPPTQGLIDVMPRTANPGVPSQASPPQAGTSATVPDMSLSDAEASLLAQTVRGDAAAFRVLVDQHVRAIAAIGRRMLRDDVEAEDVAQDAFLRLWRNAATLELGPGGVRPWLRRVVTNLCIDRIRAGRNTSVMAEVPERPAPGGQERMLEQRDLAVRVDAALKQLPDRQRAALVLFHYEGLSQIEVGEALGVTDEAVESLLARARRTLKAGLKDEWQALLPDVDE
jgi:RNA polymerase sigma-70 factor, ECF subfamily